MGILRQHDPAGRLTSAARSARGIGTLQIALAALLVVISFFLKPRRDFVFATIIVCIPVLVLPGALSILFASFIRKRRRWALICMIVLASLELLAFAPYFARSILMSDPTPMAVSALFVAAFTLLIVQLSLSFGALRTDAVDFDSGFAPIMPAQTVERSDGGANDA